MIIINKPTFIFDTVTLYDKEKKHVYYILSPVTLKPISKEIHARTPMKAARLYINENEKSYNNIKNNNFYIENIDWTRKTICVYDIESSKLSVYYRDEKNFTPLKYFTINKTDKINNIKHTILPEIKKNVEEMSNDLNYASDMSDGSDYLFFGNNDDSDEDLSFDNMLEINSNDNNNHYHAQNNNYTQNNNYRKNLYYDNNLYFNDFMSYNYNDTNIYYDDKDYDEYDNDEIYFTNSDDDLYNDKYKDNDNINILTKNINEFDINNDKPSVNSWLLYGGRKKRSLGFDS